MIRKILFAAMVGLGLASLCVHAEESAAYVLEEQGRGTWRAMFDKKMPTSEEQWEYARTTQNAGNLRRAERRMLYLVRRWPNSKEAPWAARARADILYARGKDAAAFEAYQALINDYSSRMKDYDSVLENQFALAENIMKRRRMRWLFGGYRAPEYAVEYFEMIIRNGPQWIRAPEAQFMIGQCNQGAGEYELAIVAYGVLGYRYPDSSFAEEAAWQQIVCLDKLREEFPSSPEILDRLITATTVFISTYPESKYRGVIIGKRNELYEVKAGLEYDHAGFYAKVPKEPDAAILYYKALIEEYPKSELVPEAKLRIAELEELLARSDEESAPLPLRSRPLLFWKESPDEE